MITLSSFCATADDGTTRLRAACEAHPEFVSLREAGRSAEGRPILAATVTDARAPDEEKQRVLIVAGQHGNEESGRWTALGLLDWLLSPDGRETLRRQRVVLIPDVSPDAAFRNEHLTPAGVSPNQDHGPDGAQSPEGKAVEAVAEELQPEVFVDLHARGHAGCSYDMVLWPWTRPYTEDGSLFQEIAAGMAAAGERSGIPHIVHPLTWPGWGSGPDEPSTTVYAYRRFKSVVFLTESAESDTEAYPAEQRVRGGVLRLASLLAWGNRRHPKLPYEGYPNLLVTGSFACGVAAVGATAAERRQSRVAAWRQVGKFRRVALAIPESARVKTLHVEYAGETLAAVGFVLAAAGERRPAAVTWNGQRLQPNADPGYRSWHVGGTTSVLISVRGLPPGAHEGAVVFE